MKRESTLNLEPSSDFVIAVRAPRGEEFTLPLKEQLNEDVVRTNNRGWHLAIGPFALAGAFLFVGVWSGATRSRGETWTFAGLMLLFSLVFVLLGTLIRIASESIEINLASGSLTVTSHRLFRSRVHKSHLSYAELVTVRLNDFRWACGKRYGIALASASENGNLSLDLLAMSKNPDVLEQYFDSLPDALEQLYEGTCVRVTRSPY